MRTPTEVQAEAHSLLGQVLPLHRKAMDDIIALNKDSTFKHSHRGEAMRAEIVYRLIVLRLVSEQIDDALNCVAKGDGYYAVANAHLDAAQLIFDALNFPST